MDPELGAGRPTHVLWMLRGWHGRYSRAAGLHLVQEEWGGCSLLLGVYSASKKCAEKIGPRKRKTKHLNGSKDGTAKAEGISRTLDQYLDGKAKKQTNKKKPFLTNFEQFGGIKLFTSRKQTHFGGSCPEGVFDT